MKIKNKYLTALVVLITVLLITNGFGNITIVESTSPQQPYKYGVLYNESEIDFDDFFSSIHEEFEPSMDDDDIKDPYYEGGTIKWEIQYTSHWLAQSFEASKNMLSKMGFFLSRSENPYPFSTPVVIYVRQVLTDPWLTGVTLLGLISTSGSWEIFENETTNYPIIPGVTYYLLLRLFVSQPAGEHLDWWYGENNPYPDGNALYSTDSGGTWTSTSNDFNFQIWGFNEPPDEPSNFNAYGPTYNSIELSWTKGSGSDYTQIQRKTSSFPTSPNDGDTIYSDTGTSVTDTGLTPETTYYYSAWAYDSNTGLYSTGYVSDSETTLTEPFVDLIVNDIWIVPEDFEPGDTVEVYYKIKNQGNMNIVNTFKVETYFDLNLYGIGYVDGLEAGETKTFYFDDFEWPDDLDVHVITVRVDTENVVDEGSHEDNNERTENFWAKLPDLWFGNLWIEPGSFGVGQLVRINFKVKNIGDKAVDDQFDISLYFEHSKVIRRYNGLEKDGIIQDFFEWGWPDDYNNYLVKVWADSEGNIREKIEDNNWGERLFAAENQPPTILDLNGPRVIQNFDLIYNYNAIASDWEDDDVQYQFEFDGFSYDWIPAVPTSPDHYVSQEHQWNKDDDGVVRVRAKDVNENIGPWSNPLYVQCEPQGCTEETQITMSGTPQTTKNIENIVVGDIIQSYDLQTQQLVPAEVINVYEYTEEELPEYYLIINNNLQVTSNCLLYINEEWKRAENAQIGDFLLENPADSEDYYLSEIISIEEVECDQLIRFYDLEIIPLIGEASGYWADGILAGG